MNPSAVRSHSPSQARPLTYPPAGFRRHEFETCALPHAGELLRTASRLLGDADRARDVVQEVYVQAWKSFDRFEPGTNCRAWLYRTLLHSTQHYRRKWMSPRRAAGDPEAMDRIAAPEPRPPDGLTDRDILTALDELPATFRDVVVMADLNDLAYREIAARLDIPIGTVMSRLSRARRVLRGRLTHTARSYGLRAA